MIENLYLCSKICEKYESYEHFLIEQIKLYNDKEEIKNQKYIYIDVPCFEMFERLIKKYYIAKLPKNNITKEELEKRQKLLKYYYKKVDNFIEHIQEDIFIFYNKDRKYYRLIKIPKKIIEDFYFIKYNSNLQTNAFNHLIYKINLEEG